MKGLDKLFRLLRGEDPGPRRLKLWQAEHSEDLELGVEYVYHVVDADSGEQIGRMELRLGHAKAIEFLGNIGYSIRPAYRGHHYAAQACRLLADVAREKGMDYVTITCDTDNVASRKTIESLGAEFLGTLERRVALGPAKSYSHQKYNYRWDLGTDAGDP